MRRVVTAQDYLDVALRLLVAGGPPSIKVGSLCAALEVTSGSFYGYFGSLDELVEELLAVHLSQQNRRLTRLASGGGQPATILLRLREMGRAVPHETEAAIRTLARGRAGARDLQRRLDEERVAALAEILAPIVPSIDDARHLAEVGMALLVGWQHLSPHGPDHDFDFMFDEFEATVMKRRRHSQN